MPPHFEHCEHCRPFALHIAALATTNEQLSAKVEAHKSALMCQIMDGKAAEHGYARGYTIGERLELVEKGKAAERVYVLAAVDRDGLRRAKVELAGLMEEALKAKECIY